jgi:hypothetical protein
MQGARDGAVFLNQGFGRRMPDRSPADGYDAERCVGPFEWSRAGLKKDDNCTQVMESCYSARSLRAVTGDKIPATAWRNSRPIL